MRTLSALRAAGVTLLVFTLAACDTSSTLGPDGTTRVLLAPAGSGGGGTAASIRASADATGGNVSLDVVESIEVTIDRLEARRVDSEEEDPWVSLDVEEQTVDLLALPDDGLEVARGDLESGTYENLRLFLSGSIVTFSEAVTLGAARTFEAGVAHDLFIPSAEQTGLKIPTAQFTVGDGETVTIEFDADASVRTLAATGRGILMSPVLGGRDTDEDTGDEEEDGDGNGDIGGEDGGGEG